MMLLSCSTDDTDFDYIIGATYVYVVPDCENQDPLANSCFSFVEFVDEEQALFLPNGDIVYDVPYTINNQNILLDMSSWFEDFPVTFKIINEDTLLSTEMDAEYIRE